MPLPQMVVEVMSAPLVITVKLVVMQPYPVLQARFQARLGTSLSRTVLIAQQAATVKGLGCLHRRHSVMLATTVLVGKTSQHHQATFVMLVTTVLLAVQCKRRVQRDTISHQQVAQRASHVQQDGTVTS